MIGKTNAGGSGGKAFASISVSYPAGSTCTCSNGLKTLKAKGTTGSFLFIVSDAGTWTVSCTDGNLTAAKTVTVAEFKAYSITLGYAVFINGSWDREHFERTYITPSGTFQYSDTTLTMQSTAVNGDALYAGVLADLTGKTQLVAILDFDYIGTSLHTDVGIFVTSNSTPDHYVLWNFGNTEAITHTTVRGKQTLTLDVSSLTGNHYIWVGHYSPNGAEAKTILTKFDLI